MAEIFSGVHRSNSAQETLIDVGCGLTSTCTHNTNINQHSFGVANGDYFLNQMITVIKQAKASNVLEVPLQMHCFSCSLTHRDILLVEVWLVAISLQLSQ